MKLDKIPISPAVGSVIPLADGRLMWVWASGHDRPIKPVCAIYSGDEGSTWGEPERLRLETGEEMTAFYGTNLFRLPSGALGLVNLYCAEKCAGFDLRRGDLYFHRSGDEGHTWSQPVHVNATEPISLINGDRCLALRDGRLIVPAYTMFGPKPLPDTNARTIRRFGAEFSLSLPRLGIGYSYVFFSDDEGVTWSKSRIGTFVVTEKAMKGCYALVNPAVVELNDGRLLMLGRTNLGRLYKSYSDDRGDTWTEAEPTELALIASPPQLMRVPKTGDLLVIWNQTSRWESMNGQYRHRLTCAISKDEGLTWRNHKNLASLDDVTRIEPDEPETMLLGPHRQPTDRRRYHRAPGPLRCGQPTCTFDGDKAFITHGVAVFGPKDVITECFGIEYDQLMERWGLAPFERGNKMHILPTDWFYR